MNTKERIFDLLARNKGHALSGEAIGESLGISRAAVWKGINALRQEGYAIEAGTNKGYSLADDTDYLSAEAVRSFLLPQAQGVEIQVYDSLPSTNRTAKEAALAEPDHPIAILADEQTAGRGRMGRSFFSPEKAGIYMSLLLRPADSQVQPVLLTTAAAVAVLRAVEALSPVRLTVKWVNDLFLGDKKVCGILTEGVTDLETGRIGYLVLGIGVNCYETAFPEDLAGKAGSIGAGFSRNRLAAEILNQWFLLEPELQSRSYLETYRERSLLLGKEILVYPGGMDAPGIPATALGVDEDGGLVVRYLEGGQAGETRTLTSGEVSVRIRTGQQSL